MKKFTPELLAPAGSLFMEKTAFDFGADAVYAGQPRYSLRVRNNEFSQIEKLAKGVELAHSQNKKFYVVSNIYPHNTKVRTFIDDMKPVVDLKPDALIMADPGLIMMAMDSFPDIDIHLSVQSNTVNFAAVKFWQRVGVKRIILSREISFDEISEIRQECPDMELEVFVHGALCIAYSGRCLLSGYFNHRDANQGTCTNSCRWQYDVKEGGCNSGTGEPIYFIEERGRPGELMPIEEDEHGTYILNSKDLRAIEYVEKLVNLGIDSLKIEGRTKSPYYVARTCQTYRQAINDAMNGKSFDTSLLADLSELSSRGYTQGFYDRHPDKEHQNYLDGVSKTGTSQYVGQMLGYNNQGLAIIDVKNKFMVGDKIKVIHPSGNEIITIHRIFSEFGNQVEVANGSGYKVMIDFPINKEGAFIAKII